MDEKRYVRVFMTNSSNLTAAEAFRGQIGLVISEQREKAYFWRGVDVTYTEGTVLSVSGLIGVNGTPISNTTVTHWESIDNDALKSGDNIHTYRAYIAGQQYASLVTKYNDLVTKYNDIAGEYERTMRIISEVGGDACDEHNFCEVYEQIVTEINDKSGTRYPLTLPEIEVEVEVSRRRVIDESVRVTLNVPRNMSEREICQQAIKEADLGYDDWWFDDEEITDYDAQVR